MAPEGEIESLLAERIALCAWRLMRAGRIEVSLLRFKLAEGEARRARSEAREQKVDVLGALGSRDLRILDQEKHDSAIQAAEEAEARRDAAKLGEVFLRDAQEADGLTKLSRYEAALERSLFRALHELQRLEASRLGRDVSAPAVVDLEVTQTT